MTSPFPPPVLQLTRAQHERILAHCYDGLPDEACGLLAGPLEGLEPVGPVLEVYPCRNAAASAKTYTVAGTDLLRASREAEAQGGDIIGVWHSHTHTDAYPSTVDVEQARAAQQLERPWIYVIVSLKHAEPVTRAYWLRDGVIAEIAIEVA